MDWDDIRFFLAVARAGNVTAAALQLKVNHSTVSRRISSMEVKHGVRLFERLSTGYELTEAGNNIVQLAEEIEQKNLEVERLLFSKDSRLQGELVLTMPHELGRYCIIPNLPMFNAQYPDIDLHLLVKPGLKNLYAREADIAIRLTDSPPENLIGKRLSGFRHGVYRSNTYNAGERGVDKIIVWHFEKGSPEWAQLHFPNAKIAVKVDDLSAMYAAVKAGLGIARMPCFFPDAHAEKSIVRLNLDLKPSTWGVWLLSHKDLRNTQRIKVCKTFLERVLLDHAALFEGQNSNWAEV